MEVKLTEKEFEVIIEALENLPNKNDAESIFSCLTASLLCRDDESERKIEEKMEEMNQRREAEKKELKKQSSIITGKLYMMKDNIVEPPVPFNIQEMTRE